MTNRLHTKGLTTLNRQTHQRHRWDITTKVGYMIGALLLCARLASATVNSTEVSIDFSKLSQAISSPTVFESTTPLITSTTYNDDEKQLIKVVSTHFELANLCWGQSKIPSQRTQRLIAKGLVQGMRQFYPHRYDRVLESFAYMISETGLISVNNGKEFGVAGLWATTGYDACQYYNIPHPRKLHDFEQKLLDDPTYDVYLTVASLSMLCNQTCGNMNQAVAMFKLGPTGFLNQCKHEEEKPPKEREPIERWPFMPGYASVRVWLLCIDQHIRFGTDNFCNECSDISDKFKR